MDPPSQIPRPSGIPRPSKLPVLRSKASASSLHQAPPLQTHLRPVASNERLLKKPSRTSLVNKPPPSPGYNSRTVAPTDSKRPTTATAKPASSINTSRDADGFKKPIGRPISRQLRQPVPPAASSSDTSRSHEEDRLGDLDGFRSSSRASSRQGIREVEPTHFDGEDNDEQLATKPRKSRPSLSDRTVETLARIPTSPLKGPSRRRSSFFNQAESPMKPPSRPASAMSSRPSSRPGTSDGTMRGSGYLRPVTPSEQGYGQRDFSMTTPGKRSLSATTPRVSSNPSASIKATPSKPPSKAPTPSTARAAPRASVGGASRYGTTGTQPLKTRQSVDGLAARSSVVPKKAPTSRTPASRAPQAAEKDTPQTARKVSNSSSALREQIAKAKAARKAAATKQTNASSVAPDAGFDFELAVDPFNQGPKGGQAVMQKRVDAARSTGRLNIAAMGLSEIPEAVIKMYDPSANDASTVAWGEVVDLVRFVAADNDLETISDAVFPDVDINEFNFDDDVQGPQFGAVEYLDLHGNMLRELPIGLRRLQQLTSLNLSRNRFTADVFGVISQIPSLKELRLADNQLEGVLPGSISELRDLEVLELQGNKLSGLPEELSSLLNLRILNLAENQIAAIATAHLNAASIVELTLTKNKLSGQLFEETATEFPHLQTLDVSCNSLTSLGADSISFPQMRMLNVSTNRLTSLPDVTNWSNMLTLLASDNKLTTLPPGFQHLSSLRIADFTSNDILSIDPEISRLENLEAFSIAANPLRERKLLTLDTAELKRNLRARLEPAVTETEGATDLVNEDAGDATATDGDGASSRWSLTPSGLLDLSNRSLQSLEDEEALVEFLAANEVRQIDLRHNALTSIPTLLSEMTALTVLDLSHNQLGADLLSAETMTLPSLRELRLAGNKLTSLAPLIEHLDAPRLEQLTVSNNRLRGPLPRLRDAFPRLTVLLASDNTIAAISREALAGLRTADLSNNDIDRVPAEIGLLADTLVHLGLEGNRFRVPSYAVLRRGTQALMQWLRDKIPAPPPPEEGVKEVEDVEGSADGAGAGDVGDDDGVGETF